MRYIPAPLSDWRIAQGRARRAAARAAVWGAVDPNQIAPTTVEENWSGISPPTGCSSVTNLTFANPGGRPGSSITVQVLNPSVAPVGKALLHICGHAGGAGGWTSYYVDGDGSSVVLRMLARGWHVLIADLPNYGLQPTQATMYYREPVVGIMTMTKDTLHVPNGYWTADGGPSFNRLFFDHLVGAINWAQGAGSIGDVTSVIGHSGGGGVLRQFAAVEERPRVWHLMQGMHAMSQSAATYDLESANTSDVEIACGVDLVRGYAVMDMVPMWATVSGRITVIHSADADEYNGDQHLTYEQLVALWGPRVPGSLTFYRKTTGSHMIDATQAAWVENHLATYG